MSPAKTTSREEYEMNNKLLTVVIAAAFVSVSGASWAQVAAGATPSRNTATSKPRRIRKLSTMALVETRRRVTPPPRRQRIGRFPSMALAAMLSRRTRRSVRTKPRTLMTMLSVTISL